MTRQGDFGFRSVSFVAVNIQFLRMGRVDKVCKSEFCGLVWFGLKHWQFHNKVADVEREAVESEVMLRLQEKWPKSDLYDISSDPGYFCMWI